MLTASTDFGTAVAGTFRRVAARFTIDLPDLAGLGVDLASAFTRALRSIQLDAQNQTDLPEQVRDTVGFSTIGGTCVLAGPIGPLRKETVAWLFNPDNPDSPLYRTQVKGAAVTFQWGLYVPGSATPELVSRLTGHVSTVTLDHAAGEATLGLVDDTGAWGALTTVPAAITAPPYNAGLTSEFPMDAIVRSQLGASSWPAARPGAVLSAGMRSSVWPETGTLNVDITQPVPAFGPGRNGTALVGLTQRPGGYPFLVYDTPGAPDWGDAFTIQFDFTGLTAGQTITATVGVFAVVPGGVAYISTAGHDLYRIAVTSTGVTVTRDHLEPLAGGSETTSTTWTHAIGSGPHTLAVHLHFEYTSISTKWQADFNLDDTTSTSALVSSSYTRPAAPYSRVALDPGPVAVAVSALMVTAEAALPASVAFTPLAVLDPSLNPLTVCPPIADGTNAVDELQSIAGAELGYARMDENGVYRFTNRRNLAAAASVRDVTSAASLKKITTNVGGTVVYDLVRVPFTPWTFGPRTAVLILDTVKQVPRRASTVWTQQVTSGSAASLDTTAALLPDGHDPTDGATWYRASRDPDGLSPHPGLTVTARQLTATTIEITARNDSSIDAWLTTPSTYTDLTAGSAGSGLWIGGVPVTAADEQTVQVGTDPCKSGLTLSSNPYRQDHDASTEIAVFLLNTLHVAIRDFTDVSIAPDPRLQVGDRVRLLDPVRSLVDEYAITWGWGFTVEFPPAGGSGGSLEHTLNLRAVGPPGAWIGGVAGRSEGGLTTFGY